MKSLQTIQKTFGVFQILTKIAMILAFVGAGLAVLGLLYVTAWYHGGIAVGFDQDMLYFLTKTGEMKEILGVLIVDTITVLTDGILLAFAYSYLKAEQADGTPFTKSGAEQMKRLGIRTIVLPLVSVILIAILYGIFDLPQNSGSDWSNGFSVTMGIVLILTSLIFRYGAELEEKNK
ncbi:MAG: hypothetical protein ACI4AB_03295 [Acetatifactor sp.]